MYFKKVEFYKVDSYCIWENEKEKVGRGWLLFYKSEMFLGFIYGRLMGDKRNIFLCRRVIFFYFSF